MIYTVTLNPAIDKQLQVNSIRFNDVLNATAIRCDFGGKGFNVARMLHSLGVPSVAIGFAGDSNGEFLESGLNKLGITTDFIWIDKQTRTNISIIEEKNGKHIKVNEPGPQIKMRDIHALSDKIKNTTKKGDWWVLAGSLPPGTPKDIYAQFIEIIQGRGANAILDTSGEALAKGCAAKPYLVKPNSNEAKQLVSENGKEYENFSQIAQIIRGLGAKNVIISMGKDGAVAATEKESKLIKSPRINEINPTGAGDAMVAGIVWGLTKGKTILSATEYGIACGAATASQTGTDTGSKKMVLDILEQIRTKK